MKIISLQAENVKRLKAVHITPNGHAVVQITGRNAQGKTSVLDAIAMALGGAEQTQADPVRHGSDKAKIVADLGDIVVTRTVTSSGGGTLKVENRDGTRYPSPQAMLDKLVGALTFDPLAFSRMPAKQQAETLRTLVGLDFSTLDAQRQEAYAARADANKEVKRIEAQVAAIPADARSPSSEINVAALMDGLKMANARNRDNAAKRQQAAVADQEVRRVEARAAEEDQRIAAQIEHLEQELVEAKADRQRVADQNKSALATAIERALAATRAAESARDVDVIVFEKQITEADAINAAVRLQQRRSALVEQLEKAKADSESFDERIAAIDAEKRQALADAPFPIDGLSFTSDGVLYNGVPFEQCSSAEQLRVSIAIGAAANPKLKVLLVRDGSLLDSDNLAMIEELAYEHNLQVWIERVDESGKVGVVIEDGSVKSVN